MLCFWIVFVIVDCSFLIKRELEVYIVTSSKRHAAHRQQEGMFCASMDGTEGFEPWFVERDRWSYDLVLQYNVIGSEWETELIMCVAAKGI